MGCQTPSQRSGATGCDGGPLEAAGARDGVDERFSNAGPATSSATVSEITSAPASPRYGLAAAVGLRVVASGPSAGARYSPDHERAGRNDEPRRSARLLLERTCRDREHQHAEHEHDGQQPGGLAPPTAVVRGPSSASCSA